MLKIGEISQGRRGVAIRPDPQQHMVDTGAISLIGQELVKLIGHILPGAVGVLAVGGIGEPLGPIEAHVHQVGGEMGIGHVGSIAQMSRHRGGGWLAHNEGEKSPWDKGGAQLR